ncbi:hypothetical protein HMPREF0072_0279 [Anaerococcus lactolyticus ATCC 51172]|uniref:Uncharacterized protein n=1 Tax=Anaerococcus lactolyticus ATCC 51172 TaxID=525254 RepID=C2BD59_9FIRM|nr:hypothetical protein [Anaerococcus lactolyticus]EEI87251.1 hypothetical protein HMPREF0072_0279 [Anaerococcus lactolyticus ATCC 51172]
MKKILRKLALAFVILVSITSVSAAEESKDSSHPELEEWQRYNDSLVRFGQQYQNESNYIGKINEVSELKVMPEEDIKKAERGNVKVNVKTFKPGTKVELVLGKQGTNYGLCLVCEGESFEQEIPVGNYSFIDARFVDSEGRRYLYSYVAKPVIFKVNKGETTEVDISMVGEKNMIYDPSIEQTKQEQIEAADAKKKADEETIAKGELTEEEQYLMASNLDFALANFDQLSEREKNYLREHADEFGIKVPGAKGSGLVKVLKTLAFAAVIALAAIVGYKKYQEKNK